MQRARAGVLQGEPAAWPKPGKLLLDTFSFERLTAGHRDPCRHLRWLRLQFSPTQNNSFSPQPYRQLAKVLGEQGEEATAQEILVGLEDDRRKYGSLTRAQRIWVGYWVGRWHTDIDRSARYRSSGYSSLWVFSFSDRPINQGSSYRRTRRHTRSSKQTNCPALMRDFVLSYIHSTPLCRLSI